MPRIFASLAISELILLVLTAATGLMRLDANADRHVLLGVLSALLACLVQIVAFTYLTVIEKTTAQAVHLGGLALEPLYALKRQKGRVTRLLAVAIVSVVVVVATGAARWRTGGEGIWHFVAAMGLLGVHTFVFVLEYLALREAGRIAVEVLRSYQPRREAAPHHRLL